MADSLAIGFLGAGRMSTALAQGFVRAGLVTAQEILASDTESAAAAAFAQALGARTTSHNSEVAKFAQVLILAVKPDQAPVVVSELRPHWTPEHLLISI